MIEKRLFLIIIFLVYGRCVTGQDFYFYPIDFIQFTESASFYNPASIDFKNKWQGRLIHSFYTGLSNNIGVSLLDVAYTSKSVKHSPGIVIYTEQETEYLRRTKVMLKYAYHLEVSDELTISAGASLGFFNYFVKATSSSAGASSFAPDGYIGLWGHIQKMNVGLSSGQVFQSEVTPVTKVYKLGRYYSIYLDRKFELSYKLALLLAGQSILGNNNYSISRFATKCIFSDNFTIGLYYTVNKNYGGSIGVTNFSIISLQGDLSFAYQSPIRNANGLNISKFEVSLKIFNSNSH